MPTIRKSRRKKIYIGEKKLANDIPSLTKRPQPVLPSVSQLGRRDWKYYHYINIDWLIEYIFRAMWFNDFWLNSDDEILLRLSPVFVTLWERPDRVRKRESLIGPFFLVSFVTSSLIGSDGRSIVFCLQCLLLFFYITFFSFTFDVVVVSVFFWFELFCCLSHTEKCHQIHTTAVSFLLFFVSEMRFLKELFCCCSRWRSIMQLMFILSSFFVCFVFILCKLYIF